MKKIEVRAEIGLTHMLKRLLLVLTTSMILDMSYLLASSV